VNADEWRQRFIHRLIEGGFEPRDAETAAKACDEECCRGDYPEEEAELVLAFAADERP
jgi:hypothetical protein